MTEWWFLLAAAAVVALMLLMARNAGLLFTIEIEEGRIVRVRGRVPGRLMSDIEDTLAGAQIHRATIRVQTEGGQVVVRVSGDVTEAQKQRLRNVVGLWPKAKIASAPKRSDRRFGSKRGKKNRAKKAKSAHLKRIK